MTAKGQLSSILALSAINDEEAGALLLRLEVMRVSIGGGFTKLARIKTACHY